MKSSSTIHFKDHVKLIPILIGAENRSKLLYIFSLAVSYVKGLIARVTNIMGEFCGDKIDNSSNVLLHLHPSITR